jgi:carbonic anhydrase/acetyltransferase-like protein (isoleucine patch superfamily)
MATLIEFKGKVPRIAETSFVASNAVLIGDVEVAAGASIWFGAVLRGDYGPIRIGPNSNIQDNVVVHSETDSGTIVEARVTVGHAAILHACWIGDGCVIGMGAVLLTGSRIGPLSMIGAGSVVLEDFEVPAGMLAAGNPATVKKALNGRAAEWMRRGADSYSELVQDYIAMGHRGSRLG